MLGSRPLTRDADRIGLRGRQFILCPRHVEFADIAFVEAPLDELQRIFAQHDRATEQILLRIELAQLEVVLRDVGLQCEPHRKEQRFALLRVRGRRIHVRADAAEQVDFIRHRALRAPDRAGRHVGAVRQVLRHRRQTLTRRPEARIERREPRSSRRLPQRARLLHACRSSLQVLVRRGRLLFEIVQRGVAENRPPFAAMRVVGRLRGHPAARILRIDDGRFLERGRRRCVRAVVRRLDRARRQQRQQQAAGRRAAPTAHGFKPFHYFLPQASVAGTLPL